MHGLLWLMSNTDRDSLIERRLGVPLGSKSGAELIKKCSRRLGLLGWGDFSTYRKAPLSYIECPGTTDKLSVSDEWCAILLSES
jgi:hypothetical protein